MDEGDPAAPAVVLIHGNPTWGFVYRAFIPPLVEAGFRVVVPDFLGFGRSDKPGDAALYRTENHVRRLSALLDSLDLHDVTVVPQDWGGLGLAWAVAHPERVSGLFILNTTVHNPELFRIPTPLKLFRTPLLGELLVKGMAFMHRMFLFKVGTVHPERFTPAVRRAYLAPHPTWSSRAGVLAFPREIPTGPVGPIAGFLTDLEAGLRREFRGRRVWIVWPMNDVSFTPEMLETQWQGTFPDATVIRLADAGHFMQEDAHERIVPELLRFLAREDRD
ncbi:alpha/beta fold hydrolase [Yinghuangia aomiensis]|uniref:alpha/beta fold hydrolase n=1 Tax=Yinghuangia aomiensis TaxID=676205 RepID=UPI0031EF8898